MKVLKICCAFVMLLSIGCKKVITINHNNSNNHVVIEGTINNTANNQVILISNSYLLSDTAQFRGISGAKVSVTDTTINKSTTFIERRPGVYVAALRGQPMHTYKLAVVLSDGTSYSAVSTMPQPVAIDSVGTVNDNVLGKKVKSVGVYFKDPADAQNNYRFVLTLNSSVINRLFLQDDRLTNGRPLRALLFYNNDDNDRINAGDTATVEMRNIEQPVYKYLVGLANVTSEDPSGITPVNPQGNVSNGALGYFSAHTSQVVKYIVK